MNELIHPTAMIGEDVELGHSVVIAEHVRIGNQVYLGNNVVVHANTILGDRVNVQDNSVLGRQPRSGAASTRRVGSVPGLQIGPDATIGACVVLYAGSKIGTRAMIADLASIRELCIIEEEAIVGRGVLVECRTKIGKQAIIQTGCHITGDMVIEESVFFGPEVTSTNDMYMGRTEPMYKGPVVRKGARVGANATLLPGVTIGVDAVVGAGAVVTRDVPDYTVVMGVPARVVKETPTEHRRFRVSRAEDTR